MLRSSNIFGLLIQGYGLYVNERSNTQDFDLYLYTNVSEFEFHFLYHTINFMYCYHPIQLKHYAHKMHNIIEWK